MEITYYLKISIVLSAIIISVILRGDIDPHIWSSASSPLVDKQRVEHFNTILRLYKHYFKRESGLPIYSDNKRYFKKIKKCCDLIYKVEGYRKIGDKYYPIYAYRAYNGKSLRKPECYLRMQQLYEWLLAIEPEEGSSSSDVESEEAHIEQEVTHS